MLKSLRMIKNIGGLRWGDILELKSVINYAREHELGGEESALLENLKNAFCTEKLISYFEETEKKS